MPVLASHPSPRGHGPAIVGSIVVVGALPVFLVAGWPIGGWAIAAVLWAAGQAIALVLQRLPLGMGNLASSGAVALGRMFRSVVAMVVLLAVTVSDRSLGLSAVAVYALAFSAEFGSSLVCVLRRRGRNMRLKGLVDGAGRPGAARAGLRLGVGQFNVVDEFQLKDWVPIHLGPLDLSINRAVVYLLARRARSPILLGIVPDALAPRSRSPGTRQTFGEVIYDIAQTQVAETGLPTKAIGRWFPYCATIMLFIFVVNLLGFIPLPITGQTYHGVPGLGHLRRHLDDLGHPRARADDLDLHPHRGHPLQRRSGVPQVLDPGGAEGDPAADHPDRGDLAVHAADQPLASGSSRTCSPATS